MHSGAAFDGASVEHPSGLAASHNQLLGGAEQPVEGLLLLLPALGLLPVGKGRIPASPLHLVLLPIHETVQDLPEGIVLVVALTAEGLAGGLLGLVIQGIVLLGVGLDV